MTPPFFIVGASRSGTTMLRLMLNAHSQLAVPDEMNYFHFASLLSDLNAWDSPLKEEEYARFVLKYLEQRRRLFAEDIGTLKARILADGERTLRGPFRVLMEYWAARARKAGWGEKTPRNIFFVDVIHEMFPSARFIHVVRDPRAVVQSMNNSAYYSEDTVFNALNWRKSVREGERLLRTHVPTDQQITIRYEDLVSSPDSTASSICDFLEVSFEPRMLGFYETSHQHIHQPIRTPAIQQPINKKSLTKWRDRLSPTAIAEIEILCDAEIDQFGYERHTGGNVLLGLKIFHKIMYWKWKSWCHRDQRGYEVGYPFLAGLRRFVHRHRKDPIASLRRAHRPQTLSPPQYSTSSVDPEEYRRPAG